MPPTDVFTALAETTRREILKMFREKERTAGELAERFSLAKSTRSGHFTTWKEAGLFVSERQGTRNVRNLNQSVVGELLGMVSGVLGPPAKDPS